MLLGMSVAESMNFGCIDPWFSMLLLLETEKFLKRTP